MILCFPPCKCMHLHSKHIVWSLFIDATYKHIKENKLSLSRISLRQKLKLASRAQPIWDFCESCFSMTWLMWSSDPVCGTLKLRALSIVGDLNDRVDVAILIHVVQSGKKQAQVHSSPIETHTSPSDFPSAPGSLTLTQVRKDLNRYFGMHFCDFWQVLAFLHYMVELKQVITQTTVLR